MLQTDFFKKVDITSLLSDKQLQELCGHIIIKEYKKDELIINADEQTNGLYFIESGFVRILKQEDNISTLRILTNYDYFGIISLLNNNKQNENIYAETDTKLFFLPQDIIKKLIISNPDTNRQLTYLLKKRTHSKPDPVLGKSIGKFIILEEINKKTNSILYKSIHKELFYTVTIKLLSEQLSNDKKFAERFINTRKQLCSMGHEHILEIYDVGYWEQKLYCIKEYMCGGLLDQHIRNPRKINSTDKKAEIIKQLAKALEHIHSYNIIHGNITPSHIILTDNNIIKLFGFGLTLFEQTNLNSYDSPEKKENQILDKKADLYSFGIIAYKLITGSLPLPNQNLTIKKFPEFSKEFINFINSCIKKEKSDRPNSFEKLFTSEQKNNKPLVSDSFDIKKQGIWFFKIIIFIVLLIISCLFFLKNTSKGQKVAYKFLFYKPSSKNLNQDLFNEAVELYEKEDYINAISAFNIIVKNDESNQEAKEYINLCKASIELNEQNI